MTTTARQLTEISRDLVTDLIKAQIPAALAAIRADRADGIVATNPFEVYYSFAPHSFQKTPACFVVVHDIDFVKEKFNANFIDAIVHMSIGAFVEDRSQDLLVIKADRYAAALDQVLDQTVVEKAAPNPVKGVCIMQKILFSEEFKRGAMDDPTSLFHKYVVCDLEFRHFEGF